MFVSELVLEESEAGDSEAAVARLAEIRGLPVLEINRDTERVARSVLNTRLIPPQAANDALHLAVAAVHRMHFLLTWNCRHLANAAIGGELAAACRHAGFEMPVVCTPRELMVM